MMFTVTWKVTKRQLAVAAAVMILAFGGGIWLRSAFSETAGTKTQAAPAKVEKAAAKTNEERMEFLAEFGWEVEEEAAEILEVKLPKELDAVYLEYNEIQKAQGCDLQKYGGKRCKRYSYVVTNYPNQPENVRANLLTYNGKIIGGDICSLELDGFMHGFAPEND